MNYTVKFIDEIEGTWVICVNINDKSFEVNCQTAQNFNYQETCSLTCSNDSGGDIQDSGLTAYLESIDIDQESDVYAEIVAAIESCAESHLPENSVLRIIRESECDDTFKHEKGLFGAFGPTDVHHEKYVNDDGYIVVTSEDTSQPRAENQLLGYKTFTADDYDTWIDKIYDDGHFGDCSVSNRAFEDICNE